MEESQPDFSKGQWLLKIIQKVYCEASCIEGEKSWKEYMFPHIVKCNFHLKKNPINSICKATHKYGQFNTREIPIVN